MSFMDNMKKRNQMKAAIGKTAETLLIDGYNPCTTIDGIEGRIGIELKFNWLTCEPEFIITFNGDQCGDAHGDYRSAVQAYNEMVGEGDELRV